MIIMELIEITQYIHQCGDNAKKKESKARAFYAWKLYIICVEDVVMK